MGMSGNIWGCQVGVSGFMMSGCILNRLSLPGQLSGFYVRSVVRVVCHVSCQGCLLQVSCQSCLSGQLSGLSFRPVVRVVCQVSCQGCLSGQLSVLSLACQVSGLSARSVVRVVSGRSVVRVVSARSVVRVVCQVVRTNFLGFYLYTNFYN